MKTTARLEISTSRRQHTKESTISVRVIDGPSGETVASMEIDAATWWLLITGGSEYLESHRTTHPERLGKQQKVRVLGVPSEIAWSRGQEAEAQAWADRQLEIAGETASVRLTNSGWEAVLRSWWATSDA